MSSCSSPWRYEAQPRSTQIHTLYFHTKQPRWSPQLAAPLRPPQSPPRCTRARSSRLPRAPRNTAASASISHPRKKCMGRSALRPEHLSLRSGRPPDHRRLGQQLRRRGVLRDLRKLPGQVNQCLHLRAAGLWMTTAQNPEASGRLQCGCFCHCCSCCASAIAVLAVLLPLLLLLFVCHCCSRCSSAMAVLAASGKEPGHLRLARCAVACFSPQRHAGSKSRVSEPRPRRRGRPAAPTASLFSAIAIHVFR